MITPREVLDSGVCHDEDAGGDNVLYHATPFRLVDRILREGLVVGSGSTFGTPSESSGRIFLSADWNNAIEWQVMVAEQAEEDAAILRVELTPEQIDNLQMDPLSYQGHSCDFYATEPIPAEQIRVEDEGFGTFEG